MRWANIYSAVPNRRGGWNKRLLVEISKISTNGGVYNKRGGGNLIFYVNLCIHIFGILWLNWSYYVIFSFDNAM